MNLYINILDNHYPGFDKKDERYKQITARMVLSHTTGLPNRQEGKNLIIKFDPGTKFSYSGEGYQYLVTVLKSILNTDSKGLESYFQEKVAIPLKMESTKYIQDKNNLLNKATPYKEGKRLQPNQWVADKEFYANAGIHSEALDFSKWLIALMEGNVLSKESCDELFTEQISVPEESTIAWTLGFAKFKISNTIIHGHGGGNSGFNSLFLIDRDKKWGFVFFTNTDQVIDFGFDLFKYINKNN